MPQKDNHSQLRHCPDGQPAPRGYLVLPSRREAEDRARECEADAEGFEGRLPQVAADKRDEAKRLRNPGAYLPVGQKVLRGEDGAQVVGEDHRLHRTEPIEKTRERMRLVAEMERFPKLPASEQHWYEALGRVRERQASRRISHGPAIVRRTPAARPAAQRPRTSAKRSTSRAGPDDDSGESEPPAGVVGGTRGSAHRTALSWMVAGEALLDVEEER